MTRCMEELQRLLVQNMRKLTAIPTRFMDGEEKMTTWEIGEYLILSDEDAETILSIYKIYMVCPVISKPSCGASGLLF